ncbi:MAG: 5-bromo-4-chloroindolyl phosphate hydrolysis family protein [Mogibacterium sp.]|nr:5-bromo-4-chloroindolyl phosphate hydrolysis family protein [Mogibacterium sp.]
MQKNPIRSAVLWFLGVAFLTGSGFLGIIAAVIAYNSTRSEIEAEARRSARPVQQQRQQYNPWTQSMNSGYQDVQYNTQTYEQPHESLRPDEDKTVSFDVEGVETDVPVPQESEIALEGKRYLASLRLAKASIDNKVIQEKITELEQIVENIYTRVDEKPEQTTQIRELMARTMPLTTSVLDSYAEMNLRKVQGGEFSKIEKDVIDLLDKTRLAYTKLYDTMYDGDMMDISSDISVLKTMLSQEGLLGGDFEVQKEKGELRQQTQ